MSNGTRTAAASPRADEAARLEWQIATITGIRRETWQVKSFTLELPAWVLHQAGQHYDIRLTAPDGYQAERSYSVASAPEREGSIDLTIERIEDGEVSPYMHDVVVGGDQVEVRGPIGGYFVWQANGSDPVVLVAGGSGVVPLMAMIRHRQAVGSKVPVTLLYSARREVDIIYRGELDDLAASVGGFQLTYTLTREKPAGWKGGTRRIDAEMLEEVAAPYEGRGRFYVCGPTALVEAVADTLVGIGTPAERVKTERFGPTGTEGGAKP
jgi:ferredoxin-NADP reductase